MEQEQLKDQEKQRDDRHKWRDLFKYSSPMEVWRPDHDPAADLESFGEVSVLLRLPHNTRVDSHNLVNYHACLQAANELRINSMKRLLNLSLEVLFKMTIDDVDIDAFSTGNAPQDDYNARDIFGLTLYEEEQELDHLENNYAKRKDDLKVAGDGSETMWYPHIGQIFQELHGWYSRVTYAAFVRDKELAQLNATLSGFPSERRFSNQHTVMMYHIAQVQKELSTLEIYILSRYAGIRLQDISQYMATRKTETPALESHRQAFALSKRLAMQRRRSAHVDYRAGSGRELAERYAAHARCAREAVLRNAAALRAVRDAPAKGGGAGGGKAKGKKRKVEGEGEGANAV